MLGMRLKKHQKGFTLTEMMIVVAIIAFLAILAIMAYLNNVNKANDAKRKSDLSDISIAVEGYYADHECYPDPSYLQGCGSDTMVPYLNQVPCDPIYKDHYCYFVSNPDSSGTCYQEYHALAILKNKSDPDIEKLGCDGVGYCGWELECGSTSTRYGYNFGVSSQNASVSNPSAASVPPPQTLPSGGAPGGSKRLACAPPGKELGDKPVCNEYDDPEAANCPKIYTNKYECQEYCKNSTSIDWCDY